MSAPESTDPQQSGPWPRRLKQGPVRMIAPEEVPTWIVHEDDRLLVLNKPGDVVCHPSKAGPWSSLVGAAREYAHLAASHLIFRLDRETSGVVVLAKDPEMASRLQKAMQQRLVPKTYLANAQGYALLVLQDAEWASSREKMIDMLANAKRLGRILPVIWPMPSAIHSRLLQYGLSNSLRGARVACVPELTYSQTLAMHRQATCLLTDRANLQDASSYLGIPCLTLQDHCARTQTIKQGSNLVVGRDFRRIFQAMGDILEGDQKFRQNPLGCDGKTSERIAQALETWLMTQWENQVLETLEIQA